MLGQEEGLPWWMGRQASCPPCWGTGEPPPHGAIALGSGQSGSQRAGSPDSESFSSQSM